MSTFVPVIHDDFSSLDPKWLNITPPGTATRPVVANGMLTASTYTVLEHSTNVKYDPQSLYRLTVRIQTATAKNPPNYFYLGVSGIRANGTTRIETNGGSGVANAHYFAARTASTPVGQWAVYTGYWMGQSISGAGAVSPDIDLPGTMRTEAVYFRPIMHLGYPDIEPVVFVTHVDFYELDVLPDAARRVKLIAANGFLHVWTEIQQWPEREHDRGQAVLPIVGRKAPVVLTDAIRLPASTITFMTRTYADRPPFLQMMNESSPIQMISPCPDIDTTWFVALKVKEIRLTNRGDDPRRLWEVDIQEVQSL